MKPLSILLLGAVVLAFSACKLDELIKDIDPPQVSNIFTTAESFMINPGDTALFWVKATDPQDESLTYKWTLGVGEIIGSAQSDTLTWKAPLSGGNFPVAVKVSNSEKSVTKSDNITVISFIRPYVKIIHPTASDYLVQYQPASIEARAYHDNGLTQVQLWINDIMVTGQSGVTALDYQFAWDGVAPAGLIEIKVSAISKITALTGSDSIRIPLEGIVRGKKR
jgi:hypothetical protein